jgi:hypothetical protein
MTGTTELHVDFELGDGALNFRHVRNRSMVHVNSGPLIARA